MDELMDIKQAAKFLDVSEKMLMRILSEEEMPARKLGSKWRFSKEALLRWIAEGNSKHYSSRVTYVDEEEEG